MYIVKKGFSLLAFFFLIINMMGQKITLQTGNSSIALNEAFTITLSIENGSLKNYSGFPDIKGMRKTSPSTSSSFSNINGRTSSSQRITVQYIPSKQGTFQLKPFSITVNGQKLTSKGITITVGPAKQGQQRNPFGSAFEDDFFQRRKRKQPTFDTLKIEKEKLDIFLKIETDKDSVYIRDGLNVRLCIYEKEDYANFTGLKDNWQEQIQTILKSIDINNCFVKDFALVQPYQEKITIKGIKYLKTTLYEAQYFPFTTQTLAFPSFEFYIDKYTLLIIKNTNQGYQSQDEVLTLVVNKKNVPVIDLPNHPLKDEVSVGTYFMQERSSSAELKTGEVFRYGFLIHGKGNIAEVIIPKINNDTTFSFLSPEITDKIDKEDHAIKGLKQITYSIIPNQPGDYNFGDYFKWVYFNSSTGQYDTLSSNLKLHVEGEPIQQSVTQEVSGYEELFKNADNSTISLESVDYLKIFANVIGGLMLAFTLYLIIRRKSVNE